MRCQYCGEKTRVLDTRHLENIVVRGRMCTKCKRSMVTIEHIIPNGEDLLKRAWKQERRKKHEL